MAWAAGIAASAGGCLAAQTLDRVVASIGLVLFVGGSGSIYTSSAAEALETVAPIAGVGNILTSADAGGSLIAPVAGTGSIRTSAIASTYWKHPRRMYKTA